MDIHLATLGLSLLAGVLSILSPCVLPLLPILIGAAVASHRWGPYALALGLALSFAVGGIALASLGQALDLDPGWQRTLGGVILILLGVVLLVPALQRRFASATAGIGAAGHELSARLPIEGLRGQFLLGAVMGLVWAPCVGPTLGAAVGLASQGRALGDAAIVMSVFGIGAGLPLIGIARLSRERVNRLRGRLLGAGAYGRYLLGAMLVIVGAAILSGVDKQFEAALVEWSPDWLNQLTTRF